MKPLLLEMTGLRSYRVKQSLDFPDLSLFAVIGDTGAGKSSILEAIVFALYSASTWDARGGGALMSFDADAMTVVFEFSVGDRRYRVTRTIFRNTRPAIHALRSPDDPEYRFDGDTAVTAEIRRLIGLDYDTFRKTVVLPQGRFAELLNARETERTKVLGELLGLDEIDRLREKLDPTRQESETRLREFVSARTELGDDPVAEATRLEAAAAAMCAARNAMAAARDQLQARITERAQNAERVLALATVEREFAAIAASALGIRKLVPENARVRSELEALEQQRANTRDNLNAVSQELRSLTSERRDVASILVITNDVKRLYVDRAAVARQALELEARERELQAESDALRGSYGAIGALRERVIAAQAVVAEAEQKSDHLRERVEHARDTWRSWIRSAESVKGAQAVLQSIQGQVRESSVRCAAVAAAARTAASSLESARAEYERVERSDRAAALAHELHAGELCPLCRRELPGDFEAPGAPNVAAAKRALAAAERERDRAQREHERARAQFEALEKSQIDEARALTERSTECEAAREVAVNAGLDTTASSEDEVLATFRRAFADARDGLKAATELREKAKSDFDRADADVKARSKSHTKAMKAHEAALQAKRERLIELEHLRLALPDTFRPPDAAGDEDFAHILDALNAAAGAGEEVVRKQTLLAASATDIERRLREAEKLHRTTIVDPSETRRHALDRSVAAQVSALDECELTALPVRFAADFDALARWAEALLAWCEGTQPVVSARSVEASAQSAAIAAAVRTILLGHDVETAQAFDGRFVEITTQAAVAGDRFSRASQQAERAAELDRRIALSRPWSTRSIGLIGICRIARSRIS
jgi:exonuclease SbcC